MVRQSPMTTPSHAPALLSPANYHQLYKQAAGWSVKRWIGGDSTWREFGGNAIKHAVISTRMIAVTLPWEGPDGTQISIGARYRAASQSTSLVAPISRVPRSGNRRFAGIPGCGSDGPRGTVPRYARRWKELGVGEKLKLGVGEKLRLGAG
jgi:hypothetical protein